jgi:hypothetical protein
MRIAPRQVKRTTVRKGNVTRFFVLITGHMIKITGNAISITVQIISSEDQTPIGVGKLSCMIIPAIRPMAQNTNGAVLTDCL